MLKNVNKVPSLVFFFFFHSHLETIYGSPFVPKMEKGLKVRNKKSTRSQTDDKSKF